MNRIDFFHACRNQKRKDFEFSFLVSHGTISPIKFQDLYFKEDMIHHFNIWPVDKYRKQEESKTYS